MAEKDNIISLQEQRQLRRAKDKSAAPDGGEGAGGGEAPSTATSTATEPLPGKLVWLRCPTCGTIEYTEVVMTGGRTHNVCGTQVEESAVELDLRAEYTIAEINLERLSILEHLLQSERMRYEEYRKRLALAAGRSIEAYPFSEETMERLPVEEVDAFGLLVSRFFHKPASHFAASMVVEPGTQEGRGQRED